MTNLKKKHSGLYHQKNLNLNFLKLSQKPSSWAKAQKRGIIFFPFNTSPIRYEDYLRSKDTTESAFHKQNR